MYENLKLYVLGGFTEDDYWSSSENFAYDAWAQSFYGGYHGGYQTTYPKSYISCRVRAVRAF